MKKIINTKNAPGAIGPYSQGIETEKMLFLAGQIGIKPGEGELISDGIEKQTEQIMENIRAVLKDSGLSLENIVKATIFTVDLSQFDKINKVYGKYFDKPPARSCVEVSGLPIGAGVEIEVIASK